MSDNSAGHRRGRDHQPVSRLDRGEGCRGIYEICWHCHGTGQLFVSMSPLRYRTCPICIGLGGRRERADVLFDTRKPV
ncbi:hypothetical protein [Paracoccus sp. ME4]|uniref:hypothetical protein n=1 Tax=Paracoccus sp. ME4 TaxID=3138066 RepID=UPI00398B9A89